jgi:hypothetical protein
LAMKMAKPWPMLASALNDSLALVNNAADVISSSGLIFCDLPHSPAGRGL